MTKPVDPRGISRAFAALQSLPMGASLEDVEAALEGAGTNLVAGERARWREKLIAAVKATGAVSSPAKLVDAALRAHRALRVVAPGAAAGSRVPCWRDTVPLATDSCGRIRPTVGNALLVARHMPGLAKALAYNVRVGRAEWVTQRPWGGKGATTELADADAVEAAAWIAAGEGVSFSVKTLQDAFNAEARAASRDPVVEYLDNLAWDKVPRVGEWLHHAYGAGRDAYTSAVGASWLVSAVARAYEPGCQVDTVVVLEGPQGVGKSRSLRALFGRDFYADLALVDSKDGVQNLRGPWGVEWGELAGMGRREAEAMKALISRQVDRYRPSYGHFAEDVPRRCVIVGSTNERTYLVDPTGGRRYLPIPVARCDVAWIERCKDLIWAEAAAMYRAGARWYLTGEVEVKARELQAGRFVEDIWDDRVRQWLASTLTANDDWISTAQLVSGALDLPAGQQGPATSRRLAAVMCRLGYERKQRRSYGAVQRGYQKIDALGLSDGD